MMMRLTDKSWNFLQSQQVYSNTSILASDVWAKRTWSELDSLSIHLEFDSPSLQPMRQGDQLLVDLFIDSLVDQHTLKWLNWCRTFLHAVTLSDIVNAEGTAITLDAWKGIRADYLADRYQWPRTARHSPLGLWHSADLSWKWQYSPSTNTLFHREGQIWIPSEPTSSTRRFNLDLLPLPVDTVRASVSVFSSRSPSHKSRVLLHSTGPHQPAKTHAPPSSSILDLWHQFGSLAESGSHGWVPVVITIEGSEDRLVQALLAGNLCVVSDGSYKAKVGTACAQILSEDRRNIIWITCQTPGKFEDQSSTRSELIGLMASLLVLEWMAQLARLKLFASQPSVEMACDGLIALDKSFSEAHLSSSGAQFDLASTIRALLRHLPLQRNVEVDSKAQAYRRLVESTGQSAASNPRFFHEPVSLFIDGVKSSKLDQAHIMELVSLPALRAYWSSKDRLSEQSIREVDWLSLARAMKALPANLQRWTPKHISGMPGVGKFLAIWNRSATSSCPRCSSCPVEDHLHVPRCSAPTAAAEWSKRHLAFRTWMQT
ncbi:unnamed protein product [Cylindrotheca closterium]|uniref:Uncharacterized protein n=1 Tax=Cylindrotheca closterium TaxID=2856 RepID=A0AAD2FRB9_9STRA|nr:unnamed protein product [Cylindrotheca closterium]